MLKAKKELRKLKRDKDDIERVTKLEDALKLDDSEKLNRAAAKIQKLYVDKVKTKRECRQIREQMSKLPYQVRRTFIKMLDLKLSTQQLRMDVTTKLKK